MDIQCDWCNEAIVPMRTARNKTVVERVIFYAPPGAPADFFTVHLRCAVNLHKQKMIVSKYILATATSYPVRPDVFPTMRNVNIKFSAEQWSKGLDLASDAKLDIESYLKMRANQGRVDFGRTWSIQNDAKISPEEKDKVEAVPRDVADVDKRGDVFRFLKKSLTPVEEG